MSISSRHRRAAALSLAMLGIAACTTVPPDGGRDRLHALAQSRGVALETAADAEIESLVRSLRSRPIGVADAVRIGLLANPQMRDLYARLEIAAADLYDAGRPGNPVFSVAAGFGGAPADDKVTFGLAQNFAALLALPAQSRMARGEFLRHQQDLAHEAIRLAAEIQTAWLELLGAEQIRDMRQQAAQAMDLAARLAERFHGAGNMTRLDLALQQAAAAEARLLTTAADLEAVRRREALHRLMGLTGAPDWTLAGGFAEPDAMPGASADLVATALTRRLDLASARAAVDLLADNADLTRRFRWFGDLAVGVEHEREEGGSRLTGPTLSLGLPLFNRGRGAVTRAAAEVERAAAAVLDAQAEIAGAVRMAHAEAAAAAARAETYRKHILPLRREIVGEMQKHVNFMTGGVFDLLTLKRQEYDAYAAYLEALRDHWVARARLAGAMGAIVSLPDAEAAPTPQMEDADHGGHDRPAAPPAAPDNHSHHGDKR